MSPTWKRAACAGDDALRWVHDAVVGRFDVIGVKSAPS